MRLKNISQPESASMPAKIARKSSTKRAAKKPAQAVKKYKRDAVPDRIDPRDWFYQPTLKPLPKRLVNCDRVPRILDQGKEGACTGFALAAVINYQLCSQSRNRFVSPRMIYEMARHFDEWPGEEYEGSSARGAIKGWGAHGVCREVSWKHEQKGDRHFTQGIAKEARQIPGGAYYRVMHKRVRDMHAALSEAGILFATLMVHDGWDEPGPTIELIEFVNRAGDVDRIDLPVIERKGRATDGHAVALVGYTEKGFIVQNSWGESWGNTGFALLPYEDYLIHATDVWVAQVGAPVMLDLWAGLSADKSAGLQRASRNIPLDQIRPYIVDVGNNGELSNTGNYWTTEADLERLFKEDIPEKTKAWKKRRILFYLHGGRNSEEDVACRVVAFRDVLLQNEIYPLHVMWESDLRASLKSSIKDLFTDADDRAGAIHDWLEKFREGLIEAKDRTFEFTAAKPGTALWKEMKENACLSSTHPRQIGAMQLIAKYARQALESLTKAQREQWEIHLVGHSAGSIFAAYAVEHLVDLGVTLKSVTFMAPAITIRSFKELMLDKKKNYQRPKPGLPQPTVFVLSDETEREDKVGAYGKSLLYLVSNAFEGRRETPILGMEKFISSHSHAKDKQVDPDIEALFQNKVDGLPGLVVAGRKPGPASLSNSKTHGGFDNDADTLNSILHRILGKKPAPAFDARNLQY
jgi:hypothetical protein